MSERILVAVAWPYANGPLHLGHIAGSLLPPDIFARFHRMKGDDVAMVSGSDMHGTPITVAAEKAGVPPEAFAAKYNASHKASLAALGIAFDLFTSTATQNHRQVVQDVFLTLQREGYIVERPMTAPYDPQAERFLPDRYVEGECPHCGFADARGDQCDSCGRTLDPQELKKPRSKLTGATPEYRETRHFFLRLPAFEERLKRWVESNTHWRANTVNFTQNWLREGLKDRPITRDMTYGVPIPLEGYGDKRIYVWFEAVIGYLSATKEWAAREGQPERWTEFWLTPATRSYYFLGKDNIPFHTIIWPSMLMGYSDGKQANYNLPYDVPANEFMNFQGSKFSKSRGNLITVDEALSAFQPDAVRYYLGINMPEKGDANWDWPDFVSKVNDELVGTVGNYVNRVLAFCEKNYGGIPPKDDAALDAEARAALERDLVEPVLAALREAHDLLAAVELKKALKVLVNIAALGNRLIDKHAPWTLVKQGDAGKAKAAQYLREHLRVIRALALALSPYLPHGTDKVWAQLGDAAQGPSPAQVGAHNPERRALWTPAFDLGVLPPTGRLGRVEPVFQKLDAKAVLEDAKAAQAASAAPTSASPSKETQTMDTPAASSTKPTVTIDDFAKLDLRVGKILSVEPHPKADKLYVLQVDLGFEKRQILAGLREHVKTEELLGKSVVVIANLAPRAIRGLESQGMVLAAEADGVVAPLLPAKDVAPGASIR